VPSAGDSTYPEREYRALPVRGRPGTGRERGWHQVSGELARFERLTTAERALNRAFGLLVALGLGLPHNYLLVTRGRRTGKSYSTPVNVLTHGGKRYLVAGRGYTQWVRNALASGTVTLRKGRRSEEVGLREVADEEKPEILKAYLDRFKITVQRYFPVPAGSPAAAFRPVAAHYPVLELVPRR